MTEQIIINGLSIIYHIGTSAQDNFNIIDQSTDNDLWFHADNYSSCHVIAKIDLNLNLKRKQMQTIIKWGAILCKRHTSKLKTQSNIDIIYTQIKNVKKTDVIGQVNVTNTKIITV